MSDKGRDKGLYRGVYSSLLDDRDFRRMSSEARHVFHAMRLGREAGPGCIFQSDHDVLVSLLCGRTGYRPKVVERSLDELATPPADAPDKPWLLRDRDTGVVWIRNGLRHDPSANLGNERQLAAVLRALLSLPNCDLVRKFAQYYGISKAYRIAYARAGDSLWYRTRGRARAPSSEIRTPDLRDPNSEGRAPDPDSPSPKAEPEPEATSRPPGAPPTRSAPGLLRDQAGGDGAGLEPPLITPAEAKARIAAVVQRLAQEESATPSSGAGP